MPCNARALDVPPRLRDALREHDWGMGKVRRSGISSLGGKAITSLAMST
jgi:hypothetical protein